MVAYLSRILQCVLYWVLWFHIGILLSLLSAERRSSAGLLFPSEYLCGTIMQTLYSMVFDWRVLRAGPMLFYWHKLIVPCVSSTIFPCIFFFSAGWYCGSSD